MDGLGYAENVKNYSNKTQNELKGLSQCVHVTEFGANLQMGDVYNRYTADGSEAWGDSNTLRGFHNTLIAQKCAGMVVRSTCYWHGWNNGDIYDFWDPRSRFGVDKGGQFRRMIKA